MEKTMKIVSAFAMLLIVNASFGQCAKKTDEMTQAVTIENKSTRVGGTPIKFGVDPLYLDGMVKYRMNEYVLFLFAQFETVQTLEKGSTIYVKFDDQSVLQLKYEGDTKVSDVVSGSSMTQHGSKFEVAAHVTLSESDLAALRTKKIDKIRVGINDYPSKGKQQTVLSEMINCIDKTK